MAEPRQSKPDAAALDDAAAELARLREQIDAVDRAILDQLNQRAKWVLAVGRLKQSRGSCVYEEARERRIVDRLVEANPGPFPAEGLAPVFREIISATRSLEDRLSIAYLGPEGTFSHEAANLKFGRLVELEPVASIDEVFAAVERGASSLGVVPIENTTEGVVTQTLDAFAESDVSICGEVLLRISHQLASKSGRLGDIRRVASNPQPLAQCRRWLERHLPDAQRVETVSTTAAAQLAAEDPALAAICSASAAERNGLRIVEPSIEDRRDNTTRFVVIGKRAPEPTGNDLTSAVFTIRKDEPGGLHRLLEPFAEEGINLTAIHLRPIKGKPWEYLFFLDLEGHQRDERVQRALARVSDIAHSQRVLGSYPRADVERGRI